MKKESVIRGSLLFGDDLDIEYRSRKKEFEEISIDVDQNIPSGWELRKSYKTKKRIRREKDLLENYLI